jgi:hypothetical protein
MPLLLTYFSYFTLGDASENNDFFLENRNDQLYLRPTLSQKNTLQCFNWSDGISGLNCSDCVVFTNKGILIC